MNCTCKHGEYRGYNPGYVSTVYFWCPKVKEHACLHFYKDTHPCEYYEEGKPKKLDQRGNEMEE